MPVDCSVEVNNQALEGAVSKEWVDCVIDPIHKKGLPMIQITAAEYCSPVQWGQAVMLFLLSCKTHGAWDRENIFRA